MNYTLTSSAVQKLRRLLADSKSVAERLRAANQPATISPDFHPPPFTVRWAASLASPESSEGAGDATDGEWIIYLPTSGVLMVGGSAVDLTSALTAAGSPYPTGWYKLVADYEESGTAEEILDRDTGGTLYLVINGATAEFDDQPGSVGGTTSVKIATATVVAATGARKVKQFVTSSIVITGAGSVPAGAGCFAIVEVEEQEGGQTVTKKYLANQYYLDGNVAKSTNFSSALDPATHFGKFLALKIPMATSSSPTLEAYATYSAMNAASLDPAYVTLPLYQLDANGGIVCDFRNIPRVQAVEKL